MTTTSDDGERWAEWLARHVAVRGAGGRMGHAELRAKLATAGHPVSGSNISRWAAGQRPGSADVAGAVGDLFGDRSGALLAAGYADHSLPPRHRRKASTAGESIVFARTPEEWERIKAMSDADLFGDGMVIVIEPSR